MNKKGIGSAIRRFAAALSSRWSVAIGVVFAVFTYAMSAVAAEDYSESGFQAAESSAEGAIDGGLLLIIAYAAAWGLIAGYLWLLARRANETREELQAVQLLARDLDARLDEAGQ